MNGPVDPAATSEVAHPVAVDLNDCSACVERGDVCTFHAGFAEGWDACACLVADVVNGTEAS